MPTRPTTCPPNELAAKGLLGQLVAGGPEGQREEAEDEAAPGNGGDGPEGDKGVPGDGKGAGGDRVAAAGSAGVGRRAVREQRAAAGWLQGGQVAWAMGDTTSVADSKAHGGPGDQLATAADLLPSAPRT